MVKKSRRPIQEINSSSIFESKNSTALSTDSLDPLAAKDAINGYLKPQLLRLLLLENKSFLFDGLRLTLLLAYFSSESSYLFLQEVALYLDLGACASLFLPELLASHFLNGCDYLFLCHFISIEEFFVTGFSLKFH